MISRNEIFKKFLFRPVRNVQHLAEALSVPYHLVHQLPAFVIVRRADDKLFNLGKRSKINKMRSLLKNHHVTEVDNMFPSSNLFKLMHSEDAPGVPAMAAHLEPGLRGMLATRPFGVYICILHI